MKGVSRMKIDTINVEGMSCGHCEIAIMDAIRKLLGIKKVKASKRKKQVVVKYDVDIVTLKQIEAAIVSTGYEVVE